MATGNSFVVLNECESNESYVNKLLKENLNDQVECLQNEETEVATLNDNDSVRHDSPKLNTAVWTTHATSTLLNLYEAKLEMLETPKKKTRIWVAISENLKNYHIDVTPDQVRWKVNALTKKYKRCIDMGKHEKFKYFKEMDNIYTKYNVDCDSCIITEFLSKKSSNLISNTSDKHISETKAMIEMRKARLARRINCDRFQGKIKLERQWLEYLHGQEEERQWRDKVFERNLRLREEKLEARKRELEYRQELEHRKLQIMEKEYEEILQVEREKYELLKQILR